MAVTESAGLKLYEAARESLGQDQAGTLMDLLPSLDWSQVVTKDHVNARFEALRAEIANRFVEQTRLFLFTIVASNATLVALAFAAARLGS
jgi:hypothetical protein